MAANEVETVADRWDVSRGSVIIWERKAGRSTQSDVQPPDTCRFPCEDTRSETLAKHVADLMSACIKRSLSFPNGLESLPRSGQFDLVPNDARVGETLSCEGTLYSHDKLRVSAHILHERF